VGIQLAVRNSFQESPFDCTFDCMDFVIGGQGIYPIVVILLVEKNSSLDSTYISIGTIIDARGDRPLQAEPMTFASGSVLASGGERDPVTKSPHTNIHATFDHMLKPRDMGMGTGNSKLSNGEHAASYP
jgi:hypothetical protein